MSDALALMSQFSLIRINNNEDKKMKVSISTRNKTVAAALAAAVVASGITFTSTEALGEEPTRSETPAKKNAPGDASGEKESQPGVAANMYFTDEHGNRRQPGADEIRQAVEAFQRDLARLAGKHKDKLYTHTRADGTVSATIGASKLVFLAVQENDDGTLSYGHTTMEGDGTVTFKPATDLPEK